MRHAVERGGHLGAMKPSRPAYQLHPGRLPMCPNRSDPSALIGPNRSTDPDVS
jgi:hypothetical protein